MVPDLPAGDVLAVAPELVSRLTGIVRELQMFVKDVTEPARPFLFTAKLADHRFLGKESEELRVCSGKGMTLDQARAGALGEAIERYAASCWDAREVIQARRDQLGTASLDPRRLVLYREDQYGELPYAPYRDESVLGWVPARSLVTDRSIMVPAMAVFTSYNSRSGDEFLFPVTSNGLAAGSTLCEAVLAATLEVLERDAFMIAWLNRLPGRPADPQRHPDPEVADLCETYRRRGVELRLHRLATDHPCHVFAALGLQTDGGVGPAVVVGLGADLDPCRASRRALMEVAQIRPALRRRMREPDQQRRLAELVADPHGVSRLQDHDLLYASPEMVRGFDFLEGGAPFPLEAGATAVADPAAKLAALVAFFRAQGWDLLYIDLTPPELGALSLHAARVIIPDFQPIDFGWRERRLGGDRLYELPWKLGLVPQRTNRERLNSDPHPIS